MNPQNGMPDEAQALLQQLNGIVAPEPVGLWPLAPGWWLLLGLVAFALFAAALKIWLHYRANAYRRQALKELDQLAQSGSAEYLQELARLVKRTALSAYPQSHQQLAGLYGQPWIAFLNGTCKVAPFSAPASDLLAQGLYRPHQKVDTDELTAQVRSWIKRHRRDTKQQATAFAAARGDIAHV